MLWWTWWTAILPLDLFLPPGSIRRRVDVWRLRQWLQDVCVGVSVCAIEDHDEPLTIAVALHAELVCKGNTALNPWTSYR